jgi:hypothetical protein
MEVRNWRVAICFIGSMTLLNTSVAHADVFNLSAFDTYGILINNGVHNVDINTAPVNSNIGVGNITATINLHNEVVNGKVDLSGTAASVSNGNISGTQPASLGGPAPASVNFNVPAVQTAISAALLLSTTYGAEAAQGTLVNSASINATGGFLDASGARIFQIPSFNISSGFTITGTASDFVVIDITANNTNNSLNGPLMLAGGLTPDHVLINFIGVGGTVGGAANGAILQGTFLIPNQVVNLNSLTIQGHLFGGEPGTDFHSVSNSFVTQVPVTSVPEPSTWAMMLLGFAGLGFAFRQSRRRVSFA